MGGPAAVILQWSRKEIKVALTKLVTVEMGEKNRFKFR